MIFYATTAYGFEGALSREMKSLGLNIVDRQTSRIAFEGGFDDACRANLMLRTAGRVRLVCARFECINFDQLYEGVYSVQWEEYIEKGVRVHVDARSISSTLSSVPAIQSVAQKAVYDRLSKAYGQSVFGGSEKYALEVHISKDYAVVSMDTSGEPLHKRGYRVLNPKAALRETLAAALVIYSGWRGDWPLVDPFCGSGTILAEAAMFAANMPPGGMRRFACEDWPWWDDKDWQRQREKAQDEIKKSGLPGITGYDIDASVLSLARIHLKKSGVSGFVNIHKGDARSVVLKGQNGHIITNPPYGKRMGSGGDLKTLYREFFKNINKYPGWSCGMLTQRPDTETLAGRPADKKRKLRNGQLDCRYYQFFKGKGE